jgi:hypothetical protein
MKQCALLCVALAAGCSSKSKPDEICVPDQKRCSGDDVEKCRADGTDWIYYRSCSSPEVCDNGACKAKTSGCGDGACGPEETCGSCPDDCGACCGNGTCEPGQGETQNSCPADCSQGGDGASPPDSGGPPPDAPAPGCQPGSAQCSQDGFGLRYCGFDGVTYSFGKRVPCDLGEKCAANACSDSKCNSPEVLVVLDRSSSMLKDGRWTWVSQALEGWIKAHESLVYFGYRGFPSQGCQVSSVIPPALNNSSSIKAAVTPPTSAASTPLGNALGGLVPYFGDPDFSQAVVLITDGDETCGTASGAVQKASALRFGGVRVYTIGVTTQANMGLLGQIAQAGGTTTGKMVSDKAQLDAALAAVLKDLNACASAGGMSCAQIVNCAKQCADPTCLLTCQSKGCPSGQTAAQQLLMCGLGSCSSVCTLGGVTAACESCLKSTCTTQYAACASNQC